MKHYQNQQSLLVSSANKNPNLFKWKVGSLILLILAIIFFLLCAAVILYLQANIPPSSDYTFLNSIIIQSSIIKTKDQIINLAEGLKQANRQFKFQFSQLFYTLNTPNQTSTKKWKWDLKSGNLKQLNIEQLFRKHNKNILFILQFKQVQKLSILGVFVDTAFPMPEADKFNDSLTYYTFDIRNQSDRQSAIVGISQKSNPQYLKYNGTVQQIDKCCVYQMNSTFFQFMNIMKIDMYLDNNPLKINLTQSQKCFFPQMNKQSFNINFKKLLGLDYELDEQITFVKGQAFYLY